jgi:hypothetical protein
MDELGRIPRTVLQNNGLMNTNTPMPDRIHHHSGAACIQAMMPC